ncbi:MAG: glycosyltransferase [Clostridia bacterium]|nr:glycosyltransferase [Clostridia bacterium]
MKTKILFYIDTLNGGGAEKVLRTLVNSMDQTKFDITVQTTFQEKAKDFLCNGITYKYCFKKQNAVTDALFRIEAALGLVYSLHIKGDYDVEVAYLECGPTKIISSSTNKKAKKFAWVHCDLRKKSDEPEVFAEKSKPWYEKFDKIVCVSENVRKGFTELYGNSHDSVVIYNTIDDKEIIEKSLAPLPKEIVKKKLTLLMVGRLMPQKNYPRLLKTVKTLLDEGFDFDLWILGEGEDRQKLENYIRDNNLTENIKLLGFQNNPYPFIKSADLLVCSSNYEGFSTFVAEGLVLGKTVVTTDCSGMDELLGNNEYGIITDNNDEAFLNGLRQMLSDTDSLNSYTEKAKHRGQQFSKQILTEQTQNLFFETLDM